MVAGIVKIWLARKVSGLAWSVMAVILIVIIVVVFRSGKVPIGGLSFMTLGYLSLGLAALGAILSVMMAWNRHPILMLLCLSFVAGGLYLYMAIPSFPVVSVCTPTAIQEFLDAHKLEGIQLPDTDLNWPHIDTSGIDIPDMPWKR